MILFLQIIKKYGEKINRQLAKITDVVLSYNQDETDNYINDHTLFLFSCMIQNIFNMFNTIIQRLSLRQFFILQLTDKHSDQLKLGQELTAKFPRMYKFWIGPFNATVVLNHPETIKQILTHAGLLHIFNLCEQINFLLQLSDQDFMNTVHKFGYTCILTFVNMLITIVRY